MIAFGPVPSRRLGRSLGINNIPPKSCSYSCVYCQVGPTKQTEIQPRGFYSVQEVVRAVSARVQSCRERGEIIDYLTFVPDGEPTLDIHLAGSIDGLRFLNIPIAVISNGSLIDQQSVRDALGRADWVSLKVDAVHEDLWRAVNRPNDNLNMEAIHEGMRQFAQSFPGTLTTETMLVRGMNDGDAELTAIARFLLELKPSVAYLALPIRPPAESEVTSPDPDRRGRAFEIFVQMGLPVEWLQEGEDTTFGGTGDPEADILATTAVHPMNETEMDAFLKKEGADWPLVHQLIREGRLREVHYAGKRFYINPHPHAESEA